MPSSDSLEGIRREIERLESSLTMQKAEVQGLESEVELGWEKRRDLSDRRDALFSQLAAKRSEIGVLRNTKDSVYQDMGAKRQRVGGRCPTCGQLVTKRGIVGVLQELERRHSECEEALEVVSLELARLEEAMMSLSSQEAEAESQRTQRVRAVEKLRSRVEALEESRVERLTLLGRLEVAEASFNQMLEEMGRVRADIARRRRQVEEEATHLQSLGGLLLSLEGELGDSDFWVEGFGNRGIKSMLLGSIVPMLNESASVYANFLTDGEIDVTFSSTTETKGGETRDRLAVLVSEKGVGSYNACSGGERRRADVVVLLALHDLISRRSQTTVNLLVFDEVFESLDSTGVERLSLLLQEFAKEKAVYVVSHQAEMGDFFDRVVRVRKEGGVSCIV